MPMKVPAGRMSLFAYELGRTQASAGSQRSRRMNHEAEITNRAQRTGFSLERG